MKLEELLRHVADNVEAGKPAGEGLLYCGEPATLINAIEWGYCEDDYTLAEGVV
jgi:hypothetical protein